MGSNVGRDPAASEETRGMGGFEFRRSRHRARSTLAGGRPETAAAGEQQA